MLRSKDAAKSQSHNVTWASVTRKIGPFCISFLFFVYGVFRKVLSIVTLFIQLCNPIWCCNSHKKLGSRVSQGVHPLSLPSPPTPVYVVGIYFFVLTQLLLTNILASILVVRSAINNMSNTV